VYFLPSQVCIMKHIGAVDIGGTKIAVGMVNESGTLLASQEMPTWAESGPQDGLNRIVTLLQQSVVDSGFCLDGIGIGSTGPVDPFTGEVGEVEFLPGWKDFNLVGELSERLSLPVFMENDADAASLGELLWGSGKNASRFIYVTVSTGIGVGIVIDGQLYRGAAGAHPEIGHHVIDPAGPPCTCGARGCWESLASGPAMVKWLDDPHLPNAYEVCQAARQGDGRAMESVKRTGYYLGLGLTNLINCFVPDVIALGGGVMKSSSLFWEEMLTVIHSACRYVPLEQVSILPASLGKQVGLLGAAAVWFTRKAGIDGYANLS
jgi:glucokinase